MNAVRTGKLLEQKPIVSTLGSPPTMATQSVRTYQNRPGAMQRSAISPNTGNPNPNLQLIGSFANRSAAPVINTGRGSVLLAIKSEFNMVQQRQEGFDLFIIQNGRCFPYYSRPARDIKSATSDNYGNIYFAAGNEIFRLASGRESKIYTSASQRIDCLKSNSRGELFFSSGAVGSVGVGVIYKLAGSEPKAVVRIEPSTVDGFWCGQFAIDPQDNIWLSSGIEMNGNIYKLINGKPVKIYNDPFGCPVGFDFERNGNLIFANDDEKLYRLSWTQKGILAQNLFTFTNSPPNPQILPRFWDVSVYKAVGNSSKAVVNEHAVVVNEHVKAQLLPAHPTGTVCDGILKSEREHVLLRIEQFGKMGVGISPFTALFNTMETLVPRGDEKLIQEQLKRLSDSLDEQDKATKEWQSRSVN
jgi:hypothetical protein